MKHKRWFCPECRRQWVYAKDWVEGSNCPACGGQYVKRVEYDSWPGGDYGGPRMPEVPESDLPPSLPVSLQIRQDMRTIYESVEPVNPDLWQMI